MDLPIIEEAELDLEEYNEEEYRTLAEFLEDRIRDFFDMNEWDELQNGNVRYFNMGEWTYKWEIFEGDCCEATNSHRIMYWNSEISRYKKRTS